MQTRAHLALCIPPKGQENLGAANRNVFSSWIGWRTAGGCANRGWPLQSPQPWPQRLNACRTHWRSRLQHCGLHSLHCSAPLTQRKGVAASKSSSSKAAMHVQTLLGVGQHQLQCTANLHTSLKKQQQASAPLAGSVSTSSASNARRDLQGSSQGKSMWLPSFPLETPAPRYECLLACWPATLRSWAGTSPDRGRGGMVTRAQTPIHTSSQGA